MLSSHINQPLIADWEARQPNRVALSLAYLSIYLSISCNLDCLYVAMYVYMSVTLQEGNYVLPQVSICCRLPKGLKYAAVACCFYSVSANSVIASREPTSRAPVQLVLVLFQICIALFGLVNFLWNGLLPQQNSYGSLWICVVWSMQLTVS